MAATGDVFDATNPDLTAFRDAGGKLIIWHGLADPAISPIGTIAYYQAVEDHMGGPAATQEFARLFLMPGMSHCAGGQGPNSFDALTAVITWVEQGAAPNSLLTTQAPTAANPVQSLPAYPYPLMASYNGTGRSTWHRATTLHRHPCPSAPTSTGSERSHPRIRIAEIFPRRPAALQPQRPGRIRPRGQRDPWACRSASIWRTVSSSSGRICSRIAAMLTRLA